MSSAHVWSNWYFYAYALGVFLCFIFFEICFYHCIYITGQEVSCCPQLLLLNDDSSLELSYQERLILFAGLTAAKKMLALRWQPPHSLSHTQWLQSFLDIVYMEMSVGRMHGVKHQTIAAWASVPVKLKDML